MNYLVFDIEAGFAPDECIARAVDTWESPKNIKDPEKIKTRREDFAAEARQKSALTDASPIKSIAMRNQDGQSVCIHCISDANVSLKGWHIVSTASEKSLLVEAAKWFFSLTDSETMLAGHNIIGFDIPKLRNRYIRHRLPIPSALKAKLYYSDKVNPVYDTMRQARHFSNELSNDRFIGFGRLADSLGITHHKAEISGADIPRLIEKSEIGIVVKYNTDDVEREEEVFLAMSGLSYPAMSGVTA